MVEMAKDFISKNEASFPQILEERVIFITADGITKS